MSEAVKPLQLELLEYNEFMEKYRPHLSEEGNGIRQYAWGNPALTETDPSKIWTMLSNGEGHLMIESGIHHEDRIAYVITDIPAEPNIAIHVRLEAGSDVEDETEFLFGMDEDFDFADFPEDTN
jgi:hypothetical protein